VALHYIYITKGKGIQTQNHLRPTPLRVITDGTTQSNQPASVLCNGTGEVPTLDNSSDAGYVSCLCYHWTMPMFYLSHKQTRKQRDNVIQYHSVDEYRGSKNAESVSKEIKV
jgi:hypothetical protein